MKLTRIDLNSWIFTIGGQTLLVDPWLVDPLTFYGQPWLFSAYHNTPVAFTPETLPPIDALLISQGLDDHCHKPTLERLDRALPVIASPTAAKVVRSLGYAAVTELANWQSHTIGALQITGVPGAEIQPGQVENGFWLKDTTSGQSLYYEPHRPPAATVEKMGAQGPIDVVISPVVGQKFPLLGQVIAGPEQAFQLAQALQPKYFVPTTLGDIRATGILPKLIQTIGSLEEFRDRLSGSTTQLKVPGPGDTIEL